VAVWNPPGPMVSNTDKTLTITTGACP